MRDIGRKRRLCWLRWTAAALGVLLAIPGAAAREACPGGAGFVASVEAISGEVSGQDAAGAPLAIAVGRLLCPGDRISTGDTGRVELRFPDADTTVGITRNSTLSVPASSGAVRLERGLLRFLSSVRGAFTVETRYANAGIDGTEAVVAVDPDAAAALVLVTEGEVRLEAEGTTLALAQGAAGVAMAGQAPEPADPGRVPPAFADLLADPAGATDWAIYYPVSGLAGPGGPAAAAVARLEAGDPAGAARILAAAPAGDAHARAVAAVLAVQQGRRADARAEADAALAAAPDLAAAHIASSYAAQASGDLGGAIRAARRASELAPADPAPRARLAELLLLRGDRARAIREAEASLALGPTTLGHAVLGLARLASNDVPAARAAFTSAIAIDSTAPLPRLGLGLAMIREGRIEPGRREIELAAALDPRRAATRAWLGRAYAEEGRPEKAEAQFGLAIQRDPDDPAPWLLSALQLFAENRPVEALRAVAEADLRGARRGPIRGAPGLREDEAVRGAANARIYGTLGFDEQARVAAARAVERDRANPSAQLALSEALQEAGRQEIARVGAGFAAQVYQGPGLTPVRPALSEGGLTLLPTPGPARASFAEFLPFFEGDGWRADLSGSVGTQALLANELSLTGLSGPVSVGFGQFHYETDGFRANNDVRHDVVSFQLRGEVTPWLDLFGEYRYRSTSGGDRTLEFDLTSEFNDFEAEDERNLFRIGAVARPTGNQSFATVFTWLDQQAEVEENLGFVTETERLERQGFDLQTQHIGRAGPFGTISGVSYTRLDGDFETIQDLGFFGLTVTPAEATLHHLTAYGYATWDSGPIGPITGLELTGGVSWDHYDDGFAGGQQTDRVNPKGGVRLMITPGLSLRAAYTRTVTPVQLAEQRLEPMTVAGFAQYIDQFEGALVRQVGVGLDARILPMLWVGAEGVWRDIETPIVGGSDGDTDETSVRAYASATFGTRFAAGLEVSHDVSDSTLAVDLLESRVTEASANVGYYDPRGAFASVRAGYAWGSFEDFGGVDGEDSWPVLEAVLGYRLPDQRGVLSVSVQNLLDSDFGLEDRPVFGLVQPVAEVAFPREITVVARATLRF